MNGFNRLSILYNCLPDIRGRMTQNLSRNIVIIGLTSLHKQFNSFETLAVLVCENVKI